MDKVHWSVGVLPETDQSVRSYLLEKAVEQAKSAASDLNDSELAALIDEAVLWAREHCCA